MKRNTIKKGLGLILLLTAMLFAFTGCGDKNPSENLDGLAQETAQYVYETVSTPTVSSIGGEWAIKGIADSGIEIEDSYFDGYYDNVRAVVKSRSGVLDEEYFTENARLCIGLAAIGKDPRDVEGYDMTLPLDDYDTITQQGINAASYALVAANIHGIKLNNEDAYITFIMDKLGSGAMSGDEYGSDYVAMAVQGLSFYSDREEVKAFMDEAIEALAKAQKEDGSFGNCESTAEAICALSQAGIKVLEDERFIKDGKTALDGLLLFRKDDGGFSHKAEDEFSDGMASEKGLMALNAMRLCRDGELLYKGVQ